MAGVDESTFGGAETAAIGAPAVQNLVAQAALTGLTLPEAALADVLAAVEEELGFAAEELAAGAALLLEPHPAMSSPDVAMMANAAERRMDKAFRKCNYPGQLRRLAAP